MMDFQRIALLGGIFAILLLLLLEWNKFQKNQPASRTVTTSDTLSSSAALETAPPLLAENNSSARDIPSQISASNQDAVPLSKNSDTSALITVSTDVLNVKIDRTGGDIVMVSLPTYWAELETPNVAFNLLNYTTEKTYISQSGLIGKNGTDALGARPVFSSAQNTYNLEEGKEGLTVDLLLPETNGVAITKRFIFYRSEHLIDVIYLINNKGSSEWSASFFGQIKRDASIPKTSATGLQPFLGAATTTTEEHYKKMDLEEIGEAPFSEEARGGWMAFVQHYFISAWIGNPNDQNIYTARKLKNENIYIVGYTGPNKIIPAGSSGEISSRFYAGPKTTERLEQIAPYLDLTVDYGWLWWVAKPIHWTLQKIHLFIQNWGWSIVALTVFIKIILFPLSHKAYISMGHMRKVAPKMSALREQCGDNRQKLQEEMLKLYRTEKINPMGGCLPMLLQMPVFIALYWVLMESVELRHAPFVGWIHDLSVMDPYFCLPILMGISMYFQQKMNPAPADPMQAKVMQFLPIIFTFMFLWFPSGLVLYWLVNNLASMAHQAYINHLVERGDA